MPAFFWIKAIFAFLFVAAIGLAWAYWKRELGRKGAKIDEFLRWLALLLYAWRWIALTLFGITLLWMAIGRIKGH